MTKPTPDQAAHAAASPPTTAASAAWVVHFDLRGEHTLRYRCKNVNLVEKTVKGVEDEQECLFVP